MDENSVVKHAGARVVLGYVTSREVLAPGVTEAMDDDILRETIGSE